MRIEKAMSEWANRIQTHPIWERFRSFRGQLEGIEVSAEDQPEVSADLLRLRTVVETIEGRFRSADPILLFPGPIGSLEGHLQNAASEVSSFQANRNRGHLFNANGQLDSLLAYSAQLGLAGSPSSPEGIASVENVRSQAEKTIRSLSERERKLSALLLKLQETTNTTTAEVSAQKGRLDAAITEYQAQFSAAEASRQLQAAETISVHTKRLDQALAEAANRLREVTQEIGVRLEANLQEGSDRATKQLDAFTENASIVLQALSEMRHKAENLLHVIGSAGMAGEYQKVANSAGRTTKLWQTFAASSMAGLVLFAVLTYSATQASEIHWGGVAARAFVTLTFGIVAAYAARQGDRYSDIEVRNRRYQLELSSLDPYLANLPEEEQFKVKVEMAKRLFGNASNEAAVNAQHFTGTGKDPLELALSVLMEFAKKRG